MKLIIFLVLIVVAVCLLVSRCNSGKPGLMASAVNSALPVALKPSQPIPGLPDSPAPAAASPAVPSSPFGPLSITQPSPGAPPPYRLPQEQISTGFYRFENRPPPPDTWLAQAFQPATTALASESLTLRYACDPASRVVTLIGPAHAVKQATVALHALDLVPDSCGVQAFAVFVRADAARGFDLVASLDASKQFLSSGKLDGSGLVLDIGADTVRASLKILCDNDRVQLVQSPYIKATDGEPAKVESIQEIPLPSTVVSNGLSQSSIAYRKVGLQLDIAPRFFNRDRVRLVCKQSNGVVGQNVQVGTSSVPVIETQAVESTVEMTIGQTCMLGGVRSVREVVSKGLFKNTIEKEDGVLYVVLSTFRDEPRANVVDSPDLAPVDIEPLPPLDLSNPLPPTSEMFREVLPPREALAPFRRRGK